jgi:hypothetical protein
MWGRLIRYGAALALVLALLLVGAGARAQDPVPGAPASGTTGEVPNPNLQDVGPAETPSQMAVPPAPATPPINPITAPALKPAQPGPSPAEVPPAITHTTGTLPLEGTMAMRAMSAPPGRGLPRPPSGIGVAVMAGGGVTDFIGGNMQANTNMAGFWDVRVVAGTRTYVGVEASYLGTAQTIHGLGLSQDGTLISNGVEGALRLNAPFAERGVLLEPYAFGGLGWAHYHVSDTEVATSDVNRHDDVMTVPAGAGFGVGYHGFVADVRFTYRPTFGSNLLTGTAGSNASLTTWATGAQVGWEF